MSTDSIIDAKLKAEGGYVNRSDDRGGPTNFGITIATLSSHRGYECTASDVEHMTEDEARLIYKAQYIVGPGFDQIADAELRNLAVDCGVLHSPARAIEWLQGLVHVTVDGVLGPKTVDAINSTNARYLGVRLSNVRIRFMGRLVTDSHARAMKALKAFPDALAAVEKERPQAAFAAGWMNRATAISDEFA